MTKTRTFQILSLAVAASVAAVGCQSFEQPLSTTLAPEPGPNLVFADTTQPTRDYPQSVSYIQNGDTVDEGPVGFRYRSADNLPAYQYPIVEPGIFVANIVTSPYTLIAERNDTRISTGVQYPPTYTAMPALPPANAPVAPEMPAEAGTVTKEETAPADATVSPATTMPAEVEHAQDRPDDILVPATGQPNAPAFTVAGQVLRPGTFAPRDLKLSQIVTAAGPSTEDPTKTRVQIDRPGEESAVTTLADLLSGKVEDVTVKAGDVITVSVAP